MLQSQDRADTFKHKGQRKKLVETLKEKGIQDQDVLDAMMRVPRHYFLDPAFETYAYEDRAFSIAAGQTISQPYTVAFQSSLLEVKRFDKILEVGTGSAYQSCVLAEMGARVYTIERQKELWEYNKHFSFLQKYSNIKRFYGDGFEGLPSYALFDKIIITAAAPFLPEKLIGQLKIGGIMVLPIDSNNDAQKMTKIVKTAEGCQQESLGDFKFVPMLKGLAR